MELSENGPSLAGHKASSDTKTPPAGFQKPITCFLCVMIGVLLLRSVVLGIVLILFQGCPGKESLKRQPQNATDWHCLLKSLEGKEEMSCCMLGWVQNGSSCYYFSSGLDTADWENSRQNCRGMGFDLVVVNSEVEQDFLRRHAKTLITRDRNYWIGLSDQEGQDKWQWVDDTPLNNSAEFWKEGEPSNPMEKCAVMHISSSTLSRPERNWNDIRCTERPHRICEAKPFIFY
ncbi:C-type lectin domain family 4 member C-like [Tiliqua scincoides]|uniref:C-type lectin domain family 4 member C-like n=1 Tax=Tiliqua scincoides TaxID=71010 RepID=UPI00346271A4